MAVEIVEPSTPSMLAPVKHRNSLNTKKPLHRVKSGSSRRLHVVRRDSSTSDTSEKASSGPEHASTRAETEADELVDFIEISLVPGNGSVPISRQSSSSSNIADRPTSSHETSDLSEADDDEHIDALLDSARDGNMVAFRRACAKLAARNVRLDVRGRLGWTAAHWAARGGHLPVLEHLAHLHVNLDVLDRRGDSLLHKAAANGQYRMCQWLLDRGFNVQARNNLGRSALDTAQEHAALTRSCDADLCEAILARTFAATF
jgi:hypothetical protein